MKIFFCSVIASFFSLAVQAHAADPSCSIENGGPVFESVTNLGTSKVIFRPGIRLATGIVGIDNNYSYNNHGACIFFGMTENLGSSYKNCNSSKLLARISPEGIVTVVDHGGCEIDRLTCK